MKKAISEIITHAPADGIMPGIHGQRAFPQRNLNYPEPFLLLDPIGPQEVETSYFVGYHVVPKLVSNI